MMFILLTNTIHQFDYLDIPQRRGEATPKEEKGTVAQLPKNEKTPSYAPLGQWRIHRPI